MMGAIGGDIAGSFREFIDDKKPELGLFPNHMLLSNDIEYSLTDDSILTIAGCEACLNGKTSRSDFAEYYHSYGNKYNNAIGGYGSGFVKWLSSSTKQPYNSCGNGSAMRISPIAYFCNSIDEVLEMSKNSASCTHNHPEGIKGAQNVALRIYMNLNMYTQDEINNELIAHGLSYTSRIEPFNHFDAICQETMQLATGIIDTCKSYEKAVFHAVTLPHADSDTLGCIVGAITESQYGLSQKIENYIHDNFFNNYQDLLKIVDEFVKFRNYKFINKDFYND